jgi:hypothetical protein
MYGCAYCGEQKCQVRNSLCDECESVFCPYCKQFGTEDGVVCSVCCKFVGHKQCYPSDWQGQCDDCCAAIDPDHWNQNSLLLRQQVVDLKKQVAKLTKENENLQWKVGNIGACFDRIYERFVDLKNKYEPYVAVKQ